LKIIKTMRVRIQVGPREHVLDGAQVLHVKGQLIGERKCPMTPCRELCKNGWSNWFAICVMDSDGL